jgi:hypothetical protein
VSQDDLAPRTLTRLHLDALPEAERERVEERLLADADAFEQAAIAEEELLDAFARGELPRRRRRAFAATLATVPGRPARLATARALAALAGERAAPARRGRLAWPAAAPALRWATAAAAVAAVSAAVWLGGRAHDLGREVERLAALNREAAAAQAEVEAALAREREGAGWLAADLARERDRLAATRAVLEERLAEASVRAAEPPVVVAFALAAAVRSEAAAPALAVPAAADAVRLEVDLGGPEPFASFRAALAGPAGAEAWSAARLAPAPGDPAGLLDLELPAAVFTPGRHELRVWGEGEGAAELVGVFEFRVVRP